MKRFLRWLVSFLDRKFPDKVTVTKAKYDQLSVDILTQGAQLKKIEDELAALKIQMANVNVAMGFSVPKFTTLER